MVSGCHNWTCRTAQSKGISFKRPTWATPRQNWIDLQVHAVADGLGKSSVPIEGYTANKGFGAGSTECSTAWVDAFKITTWSAIIV